MKKLALLLALAAAGCSSGGGAQAPNGQATQVSLPQFVRDLVAATADDTDPVDLTNVEVLDIDTLDDFSDLLQ